MKVKGHRTLILYEHDIMRMPSGILSNLQTTLRLKEDLINLQVRGYFNIMS